MLLPQFWLIAQAGGSASDASVVTVVAVAGVVGGLFSTAGGFLLQRRRDTGVARKDYVDGALAAQQAIIDLQAKEDIRLRALNEERIKRIEAQADEISELHAELARCRKKCDDALKRIARLEREQTK